MVKIREEKVSCMRDDLVIRGMQFIPEVPEGKRLPVFIASHGFLGNYSDMKYFCREIAEEGYAAFCFSFCGGGRTDEDKEVKSDGDTRDMSVLTEIADLAEVLNYVRSLPMTDPENIVLMGVSQGGFVSGLTAAKFKDMIKKLVMIFPAICIPDHARMGKLGGASYDVQNIPDELDCGVTVLGRRSHEDVVNMEPYSELCKYKGPVLIIHGLEDNVVDYTYSVRAKENYEAGQCQLELIPDMEHGFSEEQMKAIVVSIRRFLAEG